ncbi:MAG: SGNH/GDSL hydrolase family protein [Planctomycetes bacterium]|nr:SGNH/GDSL hydrolase family protein [Planctomycetota bacterium]MCB9904295.1 SGNH/GDSL hydrolase family protein [Planctomycetota bacterium]
MTTQPKRRRRRTVIAAILFGTLVVGLGVAEFAVRRQGDVPYAPNDVPDIIEPGGRLFQPHPRLGYTHIPGDYRITLADGYQFEVSHDDAGLRRTCPKGEESLHGEAGEIWILGCSFTYGWSINDAETFPWRLQEWLPKYRVMNYGTNGYGTVHGLIELEDAIAAGNAPDVAVIAYGSFHDDRNTFVRHRRKGVNAWKKFGPLIQPYGSLDSNGELVVEMAGTEYAEWPLQRQSALVHRLERAYNDWESEHANSHAVSKAIVKRMHELAQANGIELVLVGMARTPETEDMVEYAKSLGMEAADVSLGLRKNKHLRNLPHDGHPNAEANELFAKKIGGFLQQQVLPKLRAQ